MSRIEIIKGERDADYSFEGEGIAHPSSPGWEGYDRIEVQCEYGSPGWSSTDAPIWVRVPEEKLAEVMEVLR